MQAQLLMDFCLAIFHPRTPHGPPRGYPPVHGDPDAARIKTRRPDPDPEGAPVPRYLGTPVGRPYLICENSLVAQLLREETVHAGQRIRGVVSAIAGGVVGILKGVAGLGIDFGIHRFAQRLHRGLKGVD
jgi:hypothetical protein